MDEHLKYMYGLERFGVKPGLACMEQMMDVLGHPERKFRSIHIAGTNGKGSVAAYLDSVLRQAELSVGLYTSPHIYSFHERIRVRGEPMSDERLVELVKRLRVLSDRAGIQPTFFEFTTALAFLYFAEEQVDMAVVEVGMGGRLDATNVITPVLSVITNIGHDHEEFLGTERKQIAAEKAGIIKWGVPLVTNERDEQILQVFQQECHRKHTDVYVAGRELSAVNAIASLDQQRVEVRGVYRGTLSIPLLGAHQIDNALTALAVLHELSARGMLISWSDIRKGIAATTWEGRLDVVSRSPLIIVDGAHNVDGLRALRKFLNTLPRCDVLVFGLKRGKGVSDIAKYVIPLFRHLVVTQGAYQPEDPWAVARALRGFGGGVRVIPHVNQAVAAGRDLLDEDGCMVVTGSLYMIGGALEMLRPRSINAAAVTGDYLCAP